MKKLLLFIISILLLTSCTVSEKNFPREDKKWEGWAGHPDKPGKKPFDYFYVKSIARASQKSIERQSELMVKGTCIEANIILARENLHRQMAYSITGVCDGECDDYGKIEIKASSNLIKEIKQKECKPIATEESSFKGSSWRECECIFYAHVPGGKDALVKVLKE